MVASRALPKLASPIRPNGRQDVDQKRSAISPMQERPENGPAGRATRVEEFAGDRGLQAHPFPPGRPPHLVAPAFGVTKEHRKLGVIGPRQLELKIGDARKAEIIDIGAL